MSPVLCCAGCIQVEPIVDERKKLNVQIQAHLPQVRRTIVRHNRVPVELRPRVQCIMYQHSGCFLLC
jgi:hypothetical protein